MSSNSTVQPASASQNSNQTQTSADRGLNIVLVHGAWADGSSWSKVIPDLEEAGHNVTAVQLPLHSLADDVETVKRAIALAGGPTVLVGHSYGGFVITNAAHDNPNVTALVYVAAFAPDEGESIGDFVNFAQLPQGFLILDSSGFAYINPAFFHEAFAQDVQEEEADVMSVVQKPINQSILAEKSGVPGWKEIPAWYQVSAEDHMIPPDAQRNFAQRMNATTISLDSGHASLVSEPNDIAKLILDAAEASTGQTRQVIPG
ncbi:MAG: alpha/beta hydrolase [Nitrososphaera sp.]|nr:alpha/beta hydrolase [Nitrososphaera sp.]